MISTKPNFCDESVINSLIQPGIISQKYKGIYINNKKTLSINNSQKFKEIKEIEKKYNEKLKKIKNKLSTVDYNLEESKLKQLMNKEINQIKNKYKKLNKHLYPIKLTKEEKEFGWEEVTYPLSYKQKCEREYRRWKKEGDKPKYEKTELKE